MGNSHYIAAQDRIAFLAKYGADRLRNAGAPEIQRLSGRGRGWSNTMRMWLDGYLHALDSDAQAPEPPDPSVDGVTWDGEEPTVSHSGEQPLSPEQMMEAFGLHPDEWMPASKIETRTWTVAMRDQDGSIVERRLWHQRLPMVRHPLADVPDLRDLPPMPRVRLSPPREVRTWGVLPDMQMGFTWEDDHTYLDPFHDRYAIDAALQLLEREQPDGIILLGDDLDLCPHGTYEKDPRVQATTGPAVRELVWVVREIRRRCPNARIVKLTGNHEQRIARDIQRSPTAAEFYSLLGDPMQVLYDRMGLSAADVEVFPEYGQRFRFLDGYGVATHGDYTGPTAGKKQREHIEARIILHGHTHKRYGMPELIDTPRGPRQRITGSPGCLCRVDGKVPGRVRHPDWQQGVGLVRWDPRSERVAWSTYGIDRGVILDAPGGPITGEDYAERAAPDVHPALVRRQVA